MLLRFSAANHLSLRDPQALTLTASSLTDDDSGLIPCAAAPAGQLVPAAVIYGANASGKSNVVAALHWMRMAVLKSHSKGDPGGGIHRHPFKLDGTCASYPSTFELDFVSGRVRHHYGFEASDADFVSEWLYAYPKGRQQILFERERQEFVFGKALKGRNRIIADLTRPNSLFLAAAAQNDHADLAPISSVFRNLRVENTLSVGGEMSVHLAEGEVDERVIAYLGRIGTGVTSYRRAPFEVSNEIGELFRSLSDKLTIYGASMVMSGLGFGKNMTLELAHRGRDGSDVFFELDRESAGTRRLLVLLSRVFSAIDTGSPLVIDELDASLHTQACEEILRLFCSPATNPKGAQLIATTHDTNLLSSPLLRRDQIWFTEKDPEGATHLYPLTDIRTRKGDNIEKGYLQGRYGAVPFAGRLPAALADG